MAPEQHIAFILAVGFLGGVFGFGVWRIAEALVDLRGMRNSLQRDQRQAEVVAAAVASVPAAQRSAALAAMQRHQVAPGPARDERAGPGEAGWQGHA